MQGYEAIYAMIGQTVLFLLGGYGMVIRNDWSNKAMTRELGSMKAELKELAKIVTVQAVQTNRLDNMDQHVSSLERRLEDLRKGSGWITHERKVVDGEYP